MADVLTDIATGSAPLAERACALLVAGGQLAAPQLRELRARAAQWHVPLGEVVTALGSVSGIAWGHALAQAAGLAFVDLRAEPPSAALLDPALRTDYIRHGAIPWRSEADGGVVLAMLDPENDATAAFFADRMGTRRIHRVVTARFDILWSLQYAFDDLASSEARDALYEADPSLSARTTLTVPQLAGFYVLLSALLLGLAFAPTPTLVGLCSVATAIYAATCLFRFVLTWVGADRRMDIAVTAAEIAALNDAELPVFTVLVPMFREHEVLPILVEAMRRLDYPRAKLDVKLVLEANDTQTIEAAKALHAESLFEIVRVPHSLPKTKPKACNYALRFARGEYTVVFDAEDIPEPDQLRKVVAVFRRASERVACVQARLNYFNRDDNFLTRMFTLEYSQWFDYLLPGLHQLRIPIPLGGTSNHFRTATLLALGAWDPYNVTEDADLGVRLTQAGYRVAVVNSTTFEEANGIFRSWINQRSRWIKGYMQTWLVHMRRPLMLWRRLGPVGFLGFQLFIGFPPVTALINPLLWLSFALGLFLGPDVVARLYPGPVLALAMLNLIAGNAMYIYFNMIAAAKRRWYHLVPWGLLAPLYWVLHSVAAYKAAYQLVIRPHYWEKTQHATSATTRAVLTRLGRPQTP